MGVVNPPVFGGDLGKFHDFIGRGVNAGDVHQAGGEAEGAGLHTLADHLLHLLAFGRGGGAVHDADHFRANRILADVEGRVHAHAGALPLARVVHHFDGAEAVDSQDDGGDALDQPELCRPQVWIAQATVGVVVHVDETGRDVEAGRIDFLRGAGSMQVADGGDLADAYADIGVEPGIAGAVDDASVAYDDVVAI